ncbi:hypothetical protein KEM54_002248 [Ascosphaera aggregata]|nr:hypothetical protein KEM54_002248 [Ascosphaera aggregata]
MEHSAHRPCRHSPSLHGLQLNRLHCISSGTEESFSSNITYDGNYAAAANCLSSSFSVPNTPSILSESRNSFFSIPNGCINAQARSNTNPRHLEEEHAVRHGRPHHHRRSTAQPHVSSSREQPHQQDQDNEWLLRAGSAFSTSARKDKGQSWLVKRQSSTSLRLDAEIQQHQQRRSASAYPSRSASRGRSRSGVSTPAYARSRHGSRAAINRNHLSMTHLHALAQDELTDDTGDLSDSRRTSISVWSAFESEHLYEGSNGLAIETDTAIEELENINIRDLNRFRGFGLGNWLDRVVQSIIFGSEDDESPPEIPKSPEAEAKSIPRFVSPPAINASRHDSTDDQTSDYNLAESTEDASDNQSVSSPFDEDDLREVRLVKKPEQQGNCFSDVVWLFQIAKSSLY